MKVQQTKLKKILQKTIRKIRNTYLFSLTIQEKITLTDKVRKLSNEGLSAFVKMVQNNCPAAFEDLDAEKVQVRVDYLDKNTYSQLVVIIDHYLKQENQCIKK